MGVRRGFAACAVAHNDAIMSVVPSREAMLRLIMGEVYWWWRLSVCGTRLRQDPSADRRALHRASAEPSIGRLAEGVSSPLSDELQKLSGISYGPAGGDWNGEALAKALRSFAVDDESVESKKADLLPPLLPKF